MSAHMNRNHNKPETVTTKNSTLKIGELNTMSTIKTAGTLNTGIAKRILGSLAVGALMGAAVLSPLSARPMLADDPASPLVRVEADRSNQLAEEMLEFGSVANSKTGTPSSDRISEEMLEFGRVTNSKTVTPSSRRISEEMLEFGPVG